MKELIKIMLCFIVIVLIAIIVKKIIEPKEIYSTSSYYGMGSIRLKIYDNGNVYEDREIEETNHITKYKKIYKLSEFEIKEINEKRDTNIDEYIYSLIYSGYGFDGLPIVKQLK